MTIRNRLLTTVYGILIGTLYTFALSSSIVAATVLEADALTLLQWSAVFVALLHIVFFNRYTMIVLGGGLLATALVAFIVLVFNGFTSEWFLVLKAIVHEYMLLFQRLIEYRDELGSFAAVVIPLLVAVLTVINTRLYDGFYVLMIVAIGVLSAAVYMKWGTDSIAITAFAVCFVVMLCKKLNLLSTSQNALRTAHPVYALLLLPLTLLVFAVSWAVPKPDESVTQQFTLPNVVGMADNFLFNTATSSIVTFGHEGSLLGGDLALGDQFVMEVESDHRVYLLGSICDTYTGDSWLRSDNEYEFLWRDDDELYDIDFYGDDIRAIHQSIMAGTGGTTERLTIHMRGNRPRELYVPPFAQHLAITTSVDVYADSYGGLRADKPLPLHTSYTVDYLSWGASGRELVGQAGRNAAQYTDTALSPDELALYTALPDALPQRVIDLARELTDDDEGNYAKMRTLRRYLQQFPYTLEPGDVPAGVDFVDYFLFEVQEGYCVYYATALAVMGRVVGVPTRYAGGFLMPAETNEEGLYVITNRQAHAWVEAYFPGIGWVTFEPTPGAITNAGAIDAPVDDPAEEPELPIDEPETPDEPLLPEEPENPDEGFLDDLLEDGGRGVALFSLFVVLCVVGGVLLVYAALVIRHRVRMSRVARLDNRAAVRERFSFVLHAAAVYGQPIRDGETALTYGQRAGRVLQFESGHVRMDDLCEIATRAMFSPHSVSDHERHLMRRCHREMLRKLKDKRKRGWRYFIRRYVLLQF